MVLFSHRLKKQLAVSGVVAFATLASLFPHSPANMSSTFRDSGVFLYIGSRILAGDLPYRDVWDHKPPVILYLNALGLWMNGGSRWGVWVIEIVAVGFAAWLIFNLIQKMFGGLIALLTLFIFLAELTFILEGGNLATEYALPLQVACLALYQNPSRPRSIWLDYLQGVCFGLLFLTKQNLIGIPSALVLFGTYTAIRQRQIFTLVKSLIWIAVGSLTVLGVVGIYFWIMKGGSDLWSAVFVFNVLYANSFSWQHKIRLNTILDVFHALTNVGSMGLGTLGWSMVVMFFMGSRLPNFGNKNEYLLLIAAIDLPLELLFIFATGRPYTHYYIALLPSLVILAAFPLSIVRNHLTKLDFPSGRLLPLFSRVILLIIFPSTQFGAVFGYRVLYRSLRDRVSDHTVTDYVQNVTAPKDFILVLGGESGLYFMTRRVSATRFIYQEPLYMPQYSTVPLVEEFLGDIVKHRPKVIVDSTGTGEGVGNFPVSSQKIEAQISFFQEHYAADKKFGTTVIYRLID